MIDIESEVFNTVSKKVREKYLKIYMTSEYIKIPPSFPCASLLSFGEHPTVGYWI